MYKDSDKGKQPKRNNVMYDLLSLKKKLLVTNQLCDKCHQPTDDWFIIGICHHVICRDCMKPCGGNNARCPSCKTKFNPKLQVVSDESVRIAYAQLEELVWKILQLEKENLVERQFPEEDSHAK